MRKKLYVNNNISACIKLNMLKKRISTGMLADSLNIDIEYLNLFFSRSIFIKNTDILFRIIEYLKLDSVEFFKRNLEFEKIRNQFFHSFFYCLPDRKILYDSILDFERENTSTPYSVDILIIKFIYETSIVSDFKKITNILADIYEIELSLTDYYKKLFYIYVLYYFNNYSKYEDTEKIFLITKKMKNQDVHLDGRMYYAGLSVFRNLGKIREAKKCYFKAKEYFDKVSNFSMLENLNIKYSGLLRLTGNIKSALVNDLKLVEDYTVKRYRLRNIEILYNNIAWTYSLLHDYKKAIIYYQKALETLNDNDVYFNMAYCCFKVGENALAMNYLQLGKKAPNCGEYIYLLLDWLEQMIKDVYSNKSFQMLKNVLLKYENDLEEVDKNTIQIEIINYYYYNGMYEEAINALQPLMGKQLISPSELIFAKDNGKNEHDTLSFEDMDDTWNDKMIIKDDDLFFDDEKINDDDWEELDDSFSSFAFN